MYRRRHRFALVTFCYILRPLLAGCHWAVERKLPSAVCCYKLAVSVRGLLQYCSTVTCYCYTITVFMLLVYCYLLLVVGTRVAAGPGNQTFTLNLADDLAPLPHPLRSVDYFPNGLPEACRQPDDTQRSPKPSKMPLKSCHKTTTDQESVKK